MERQKRTLPQWAGPAAAAAVTLLIWGHSMAPADMSSAESGWVTQLLAPILEWLKVNPELWENTVRKAAHMTEFGVLGAVWTAVLTGRAKLFGLRRLGAVAGLCMATALIDETIQLFVEGRNGQIADVWIDLLGAAVGAAAALAVLTWRKNRKSA